MTGRGIGRALAAAVLAGASGCRPVQYDLVLVGGRVVDRTGNSWFYGDVAVRGVRIARVAPAGALATASARRRIAVGGLVVAPGFIDIIGQSRNAALRGDGRMVSKVTQGVTTEIMGEGITDAPVNDRTQSQSVPDAARTDLGAGWRRCRRTACR